MLAWLVGTLPTPALAQAVSRQSSAVTPFAPVVPGYKMQFPRDGGSHPDFRLEWWYVTGWLGEDNDRPLGFQVTFFRVRPPQRSANPSAFAPHHLMIAHAAVSDPQRGRLHHDQRAARIAFDLAGAAEGRTEVWVDNWSLRQEQKRYTASIAARHFRLDLAFSATQPPLLQGAAGFSQKGPRPESASYYYSLPQLAVSGTITREGSASPGRGLAWLDHEWSSSYLDERAVGWDWIGINLDDGGALMAFQMRDGAGGAFWAGGASRSAAGDVRVFERGDIRFTPLRRWKSPRTGANYPVSWRVRTGDREIEIECLFEDQENDTRATTGAIYWEGAVRALLAGRSIGRGYLELTGYWRRLRL
jgi:predicted secreted hydrolase